MSLRARSIVLAAVLILAAVPAMGQPAPPPKQDAGPPGAIRGRITAADTGRPLRRVRVSLHAVSAPTARPVAAGVTNAQGAFELKDVPAGSYYLSGSRAGYIDLQHGQRRPRERGVAIEVKSGETIERIDIALPRAGAIAGRIVDERGEPYPGIRVMANDIRYMNGRRTQFPAGSSITDDLGQYRIAGLPPGSYSVSAISSETWLDEKKQTLGYTATYYPGVAADTAEAITLGVSEQRLDVDFPMVASRTVRVSGRAQRSSGEPLANEPVSLLRAAGAGAVLIDGAVQGRTAADGSFDFQNVPPANYMLRAGSGDEIASMDLPVKGADVKDLVLVTRIGSTITGNIVIEDGSAPPFPASGVRLNLITDADVLPTVRVPGINDDWTFRLTSVVGPFVFRVAGLPQDWMLEKVTIGDREITDTLWDVPTGGRTIVGLQFVLTQKVGRVSGAVLTADDKPTADATVVLFADDASQWGPGSRFVHSTRPNANGEFTFGGLPAGHFLAVARDFIIDGQWQNREYLESVRKDALRVILDAGGTNVVSLRLPRTR